MNFGIILGITLFISGCFGFLVRRNAIVIFLSLELMVNGAILTLLSFSANNPADAMLMGFFIIAVAAAEAVVGLAIILRLYRTKKSTDISLFSH